ncbi:hypothetical protein C7N43_15780 [Sphingobacteriales bacterium UPWRP_1]|nr:hypothetical protein BVG80_04425 [Sphingobacteriales bacterium TSM_CSM]PSJ76068.1 hypothetical protein C7N43_15780 [Sphingobacteriales bacterium UPWRP_1]
MQKAFWVLFIFNLLASVYFTYLSAMHVFIYFANKRLGHPESFFLSKRSLVIAAIFIGITAAGYFVKKYTLNATQAVMILGFPLFLALLYGLFAVVMIIGSGGRWN